MAILHGKLGLVNGQSTVAEWQTEYWGEPPPWITSQTESGEAHACGPYDWRGWFRAYGHTPGLFPGEAIIFAGNLGNGSGVSGAGIVDEIDITCDIERAIPLQYFVRFSRNGTLTRGSAPGTDGTAPAIFCPTSLMVKLNGGQQTDTRYWRLVLRCANKKYITSENVDAGYKRIAGVINGQFLYRVYMSNPSVLPTEGDNYLGAFYVTASSYWSVSWCKIVKIEDVGAGGEREGLVGADVSGVFNAHDGTAIGAIITPAGATKWPV